MNKRIAEKVKGEKDAEMVAKGKEEDEKKKKAAVQYFDAFIQATTTKMIDEEIKRLEIDFNEKVAGLEKQLESVNVHRDNQGTQADSEKLVMPQQGQDITKKSTEVKTKLETLKQSIAKIALLIAPKNEPMVVKLESEQIAFDLLTKEMTEGITTLAKAGEDFKNSESARTEEYKEYEKKNTALIKEVTEAR